MKPPTDPVRSDRPVRLLLVEDHPADARLIRAQLEDGPLPCEVGWARSLAEVRGKLAEADPDVCLLDLDLADSRGTATVRRFRLLAPHLPVLVLTGLHDPEAGSRAIRAGAEEYLIKDEISPSGLSRTIRYVLEREESRRARGVAEEKWATVFEHSPVPMVISDADSSHLLEVNNAFLELFGQSREEMLGSTALELGHWADPGRRRELVEEVRERGFLRGEEAGFRDAEGREGRMRLSCRRLHLAAGDRLLWTVRDVTEQAERERMLRERVKEQSCLYDVSLLLHQDDRPLSERLQAVVDRIPAGWQHDGVAVVRLRVEEERYVSGGWESPVDRLEAALEVEGEPVGELVVGYREERPEEDLGPFLVEERRLLDEVAGQIEVELSRWRVQREMLHVVETMNEAVTIAAPDGTITFANSAARRLFSPGQEGYVGEDLTDFAPQVETLEGEPYPPEDLPFQTVLRTGEPVTDLRHAIHRADGERIVVSVNAAPMRDDGPEVRGVVLTVRDVTEQVRTAEWRHLLETSVEAAAHGIMVTDREGRIVWVNATFTEMTGYDREEVLGEDPGLLRSGEQDEAFYEELWETILAGETWEGELVNRRKDGTTYAERQSIVPVHHRGDEITHFIAVKEDVTEQRTRQSELEETTRRLQSLLETATGIIFRVRVADLGLSYVSPNVEELVGFPLERWTEEPRLWLELIPSEDLERVLGTVAAAVRVGAEQAEEEYRFRHADGSVHWYRTTARFEFDDDGEPLAFVGTSIDVTQRRELEEQLRQQALHDPLTGLANRTLFADHLEQAVERSRRRDAGVAVLMADLDRFKRVNESLGHAAGDRVLVQVARRFEDVIRAEDTVARWGGDEFCLLLNQVEARRDLERVRDRLFGQMRRSMTVMGREVTLDFSLGAVLAGLSGEQDAVSLEEAEDLVRYADQALHRAKGRTRGTFHLYRPEAHGRELADPLTREQELRRALEREAFEPFYQPIVRLEDGEVWGMEALARWRHAERGLVGPGEFIGLAEETRLVHELGRQITARAFRDAAAWQAERPLRLAINVSAGQFEDDRLVATLDDLLAECGLPPERVLMEVTETSVMRAVDRIEELREMGVGVLIDDFGTGYSSLRYLRDLPVDGLKIDMSFVQGLGSGRSDAAIVEATLTLGRAMDLLVVAEGVETESQRRQLRELGCELGQGYLFARPMPASDAGERLAGR